MDTYSEAHRLACEARWCLKQTKEARQAYYLAVEKARGREAVNRLIDAVREAYESQNDERDAIHRHTTG